MLSSVVNPIFFFCNYQYSFGLEEQKKKKNNPIYNNVSSLENHCFFLPGNNNKVNRQQIFFILFLFKLQIKAWNKFSKRGEDYFLQNTALKSERKALAFFTDEILWSIFLWQKEQTDLAIEDTQEYKELLLPLERNMYCALHGLRLHVKLTFYCETEGNWWEHYDLYTIVFIVWSFARNFFWITKFQQKSWVKIFCSWINASFRHLYMVT